MSTLVNVNLCPSNWPNISGVVYAGMATFLEVIHISLDNYVCEPIKTGTEKSTLHLFTIYVRLAVELEVKLNLSECEPNLMDAHSFFPLI